MADDVWAWCEKTQAFGHTVTVKIKYADFQQVTRSRTVALPVISQAALRDISCDLVRTVYSLREGVRLVGVALSNFRRAAEAAQLDLSLTPFGP